MEELIKSHIDNWIKHISTPSESLGGFSVCPYAKGTEYEICLTTGDNINPPPWDFDLIIYVLPDFWTQEELFSLAEEYNKIYPSIAFLPDHKNRDTFINGVKTNNGKYNLLLCQWRTELNSARDKLSKTLYYSFWPEEYLKEILGT